MMLRSRCYWPLLLFSCLVSTWAWPSRLAAESPICACEGSSTANEAIAVLHDSPAAVGGIERESLHVRHATLRALLAVEHCPKTAERTFSQNPKSTEHWIAAIIQILEPYSREEQTRADLGELAQQIDCSARTPFVCKVREQLLTLSTGTSQTNRRSNTCITLGPILMKEAAEDFISRSGDSISPTDDLAFILEFCPDSFFAYMHEHRAVLDDWCVEVQRFLFWGNPEDKALLKSYRATLIDFVEHRPTRYTAEKEQILQCLKAAHVEVYQ